MSNSRFQHLHFSSPLLRLPPMQSFILTSTNVRCGIYLQTVLLESCLLDFFKNKENCTRPPSQDPTVAFSTKPLCGIQTGSSDTKFRLDLSVRTLRHNRAPRHYHVFYLFSPQLHPVAPVQLLKICARCVSTTHFFTINIVTLFTPGPSNLCPTKSHPSVAHTLSRLHRFICPHFPLTLLPFFCIPLSYT